MARPNEFPLDLVMAASSLDRAQAAALKAGLTQELALLQGPPGTGAAGLCRLCALRGLVRLAAGWLALGGIEAQACRTSFL